jgi:hypothetical protein
MLPLEARDHWRPYRDQIPCRPATECRVTVNHGNGFPKFHIQNAGTVLVADNIDYSRPASRKLKYPLRLKMM